MSTTLVISEVERNDAYKLGKVLSESGFFQDARGAAQAFAKILAGRELGIPPMASMMGVNIIKGKVALGANLIATRIRAHGYDYRVKSLTDKGCTIEFLKAKESLGISEFSEADAKKAGLSGANWKNYPRNMYFARAISNGAKWFTPEVFGGSPVYTPDELGAEVNADGEVIHKAETPEQLTQRRIDEEQAKLDKQRAERQLALAPAPPTEAPPQETPAEPPAEVSPAVAKLWATMIDMKSSIEVLLAGKAKLKQLLPEHGELEYYRVLKFHGAEHANQFQELAPMKRVARDLLSIVETAEAMAEAEKPYQATDDDVPEILRGESGTVQTAPATG